LRLDAPPKPVQGEAKYRRYRDDPFHARAAYENGRGQAPPVPI
jgi:hypothetical protein